jgi:hypothetical protein
MHDEFDEAAAILAAVHERDVSFRVRNYALGARARAIADAEAETR